MTYQTPHRIAVLSFVAEGGSKVEASRIFKVSRETIYRWLRLDDIAPKPPPKTRHRKIDKDRLSAHVASILICSCVNVRRYLVCI